MPHSKLLQQLSASPVLGVSMASVSLLRLDRLGGLAPGNKAFKLKINLEVAREQAVSRLVTFGGAWSNHLHALAAAGQENGFQTVGIVRGERPPQPSAMLRDAERWGMQLVYVPRSEYALRNDPVYLERLTRQFGPCHIIPEGGANTAGVRGCMDIVNYLPPETLGGGKMVLAVGTGTTLAGLVAGSGNGREVIGISVLKGARGLERDIECALEPFAQRDFAPWHICHDFHCGGYARVSPELREFIEEFERIHGIPLDPVYTGKMLFAIYSRLRDNRWHGPITAIHTGGLQGRRGFPWLATADRL